MVQASILVLFVEFFFYRFNCDISEQFRQGSVLSNLHLVLGVAFLAAGIKFKSLDFNATVRCAP